MCFQGDDQSIDDGMVGGGVQVVQGNSALDRSWGESSKVKELIEGGGVFSDRY